MSHQLCWFRTDLRVRDNRALAAALAAGPTVALYIATPGQWAVHEDAAIKLDFWRRSLHCLEDELARLGVTLLYLEVDRYDNVPDALQPLLSALRIVSMHCNREYPLNEQRRDAAVARLCAQQQIDFACHEDKLLLPVDALRTQAGEPFKVFTPYARRARERLTIAPAEELTPLAARHKHREAYSDLLTSGPGLVLDELSWPAAKAEWAERWPAGEAEALRLLDAFCADTIAQYHEQRDFPALSGTSQLSPHLTAGTIATRQCWRAAGRLNEGKGVETWRSELLWRDFYHYVMHHFPHVCLGRNWRDDVGHVAWRDDEEDYKAWCEGRTGIPIVDAAMLQLRETGWMHNRLRMVVAMFFSKNLLLDWRRGESWFMRHLIDGEYAANNGGWQWSSSTGTDAAPYFRIFNPVTQSQRFDPEGRFIKEYLPQLASLDKKSIHDPTSLGMFGVEGYPEMMVDLKVSRERALAAFKK